MPLSLPFCLRMPIYRARTRARGLFLESSETFRFRRISGDIILFVSSKLRRLGARNFAVTFIFIPFITYERPALQNKQVGVYEWLFGPEKFSGPSRNGSRGSNQDFSQDFEPGRRARTRQYFAFPPFSTPAFSKM